MVKGVFSRAGDAFDRVHTEGLEHVRRGPLAIAFDPAPAAVCGDVDEVTCVLNGYLYDPAGLARELSVGEGNPAELVARVYRRSGEAILTKLRGRYALALWDGRSQRGLLACDVLAMEALYYWRGAGGLAFASELRDLFSLLPATPGPDSIAFTSWLAGGLSAVDRTLYDGVSRLAPGRLIDLSPEVCEARRYWRPRYQGTLSGTRDELAEGLRTELERSVGRRLSMRLSGVVLSGGLDSSIVTTIASRQREPGQLRTYSAVFPGRSFDESWKVKRLTEFLGIEPAAFTVEPQGALWLALKHVQRWGLPLMGAGAVVDMPMVREAGCDGVEVVLDGQTGDETLGFAPYLLSDRLRHGRLIAALRLTGRWPLGRPVTPQERRWVLKHVGLKGALPYRLGKAAKRLRKRDGDPGPPWLAPPLRRLFVEQQDPWAWKVGSSGPRWWRYLSDKIVEGPHRDLRMDYLRHRGAAAGVVNDSPLYDFDVVDYCLRLPPELAFASEHSRPLARHALRDLMPDDVRLSHEKADFSSFCFEILTNADAPGIERLLDAPNPEMGAYVDMGWVRRLWYHDRPATGKHTGFWGSLIWLMVAGECWLRAQADPGFAENMLAHDDVRSPSVRRVSLADNGTFFHLAGTGPSL